MNTKKSGEVRFIVFREKGKRLWTGVCLDFGILVENADRKILVQELVVGAKGYLENVVKNGLSDELLNNQAPAEYFELVENFTKPKVEKRPERTSSFTFSSVPSSALSKNPHLAMAAC